MKTLEALERVAKLAQSTHYSQRTKGDDEAIGRTLHYIQLTKANSCTSLNPEAVGELLEACEVLLFAIPTLAHRAPKAIKQAQAAIQRVKGE